MTCPKSNAPIDAEMKSCTKCGAEVATSGEKPRSLRMALPSMDHVLSWVVAIAIVLILLSNIHVNPTGAFLKANMAAVGGRGKDIYNAITAANTERVPLAFSSIWPKTYLIGTNALNDISSKVFTTSTEYFKALYDEKNIGTDAWHPYVKGFDYSKLAGAGVKCCIPGNPLAATNNMWIIAANITDQDDDRIPFLITRNVDVKEIERVVNHGLKASEFKIGLGLGKGQYWAPFYNKGLVAVFKGGATFNLEKRTVTLGDIFKNKELPARDPSKPPIVYLMP